MMKSGTSPDLCFVRFIDHRGTEFRRIPYGFISPQAGGAGGAGIARLPVRRSRAGRGRPADDDRKYE
jgi:hypothetical protein